MKCLKVCTMALISLIPFRSFAQDAKPAEDQRKMIFGLKFGTNMSWYKPDTRNLDKGGFKPGISYGLMGDYNFQPNYSVAFEFLVSNLNGKMTFRDSLTYNKGGKNYEATNVQYEYSNRYVQIPVSFKFRTKEIGYMKYFAQFGLAPAVRVSSRAVVTGQGFPWSEDDLNGIKPNDGPDEAFESSDFDDDVSLLNIPLIIGGGIEYNVSGNTSIYACLRYENGFNNVLQSNSTTVYSKNISVSVGVFF